MGAGEQGVTIDVLVEVVKRHLDVPAAATSTEYDASSIHKLNVPRWERLADGSLRRRWEIRFVDPIADAKLTVFAGLSEPSTEVHATFSDDRRTVTLVTTTTSSTPYSDDVFYGAPYRMMRALNEAVGAIELIQGQPRDLWQPFR